MAAGAAVLLSSHVLSEVERVADRVAIIRSGRLLMTDSLAGLREKARHTVEVRFGSPPPPDAFAGVPGITDVRLDGTLLRCTMQGVVDPLIKTLSRYHVVDLNSHEADLEETFLALYGEEAPEVSTITAARTGITGRWEITRQALRAARRTLAIWAASFAGLIALYAVIWPSVRGNTSWRNLFDTLPADLPRAVHRQRHHRPEHRGRVPRASS